MLYFFTFFNVKILFQSLFRLIFYLPLFWTYFNVTPIFIYISSFRVFHSFGNICANIYFPVQKKVNDAFFVSFHVKFIKS